MRSALILAAAAALAATQARAADPAEGDWLVQDGEAKVRISPCQGRTDRLCGAIVWLKSPRDETGQPKHDVKNPEPGMRIRPILGLPLIRDFRASGPGRWEGGTVYDPKSGRTYEGKLQVAADGKLKLAGCVMVFCETQTWTRAG